MPELPEVETIRIGLARLLPGKIITQVTHDNAKSFPNSEADVQQFLIGAVVKSIERRAKVLIINLDSQYTLLIHLKMTGQMVYRHQAKGWGAGHPTGSLTADLPDRSTRVIFEFSDGSRLFFNDQRKFGWVRLLPTIEVPNIDFMKKIGPEPLSPDFTNRVFRQRVSKRARTNIKAAILDQTVLAGVGNIYADESLWGAKIHPAQLVKNLTDNQLNNLFKQIQVVLRLGIEKGGSTDRNYVDAEGRQGTYLAFANVFRREGKPCPRCGSLIEKIRVAGRGTHICPVCQKGPAA